MNMTARELFDLMHTRLSRVGAWPEGLHYQPEDKFRAAVFTHDDVEPSVGHGMELIGPGEIGVGVAAAVLRAAAEDALKSEATNRDIQLRDYTDEGKELSAVIFNGIWYSGPTLLEALAAALDAVGGKG